MRIAKIRSDSSISSIARSNPSSERRALHAPLLRQLQGPRRRPACTPPMFPAFLEIKVDEARMWRWASREFAELELIGPMSKRYGRGDRHRRCEELLH